MDLKFLQDKAVDGIAYWQIIAVGGIGIALWYYLHNKSSGASSQGTVVLQPAASSMGVPSTDNIGNQGGGGGGGGSLPSPIPIPIPIVNPITTPSGPPTSSGFLDFGPTGAGGVQQMIPAAFVGNTINPPTINTDLVNRLRASGMNDQQINAFAGINDPTAHSSLSLPNAAPGMNATGAL